MKLLFVTIATSLLIVSVCQAADIGEILALNELYSGCGGIAWYRQSNWLKGDPCDQSWSGVQCNTAGHVTGLSMNRNNMRGTLSPTLPNLIYLTKLDLSDNYISGALPSTMGNYYYLTYLDVSANKMNSSLPSGLSKLKNVYYFDVSDNEFSGPLPDKIGNMASLQYLYVEDNYITGPLPSSLGDLSSVSEFFMYDNVIDGTIPEEITGMSSMKKWLGYNNRMSGSLPDSLGSLTSLTYLDLSSNKIGGELPSTLPNMKKLQSIYLTDNTIAGLISDKIGNMLSISTIEFSDNLLESPLPKFLQTRPINIPYVTLKSNNLTCPLPPWCAPPPSGNGNCAPCHDPNYQILCCTYQINSTGDFTSLCTLQPGCPAVVGWTAISGKKILDCDECDVDDGTSSQKKHMNDEIKRAISQKPRIRD